MHYRFNSGKEMLTKLWGGVDLYSPSANLYVFAYNDSGSIAYYSVDEEEAKQLQELSKKHNGEYWGAFLGPGGWIIDDPSYEEFHEGDETNLDFCNNVYRSDWIDTSDIEQIDGGDLSGKQAENQRLVCS